MSAKHRNENRYPLHEAIEVSVGFGKYFVFLESEIVVQEVIGKGGKVQRRRVTSRRIETAAILRASDIAGGAA